MSNKNEKRVHEIEYHIYELLSELQLLDPMNRVLQNIQPFNLSINSHETCFKDNRQCPCLLHKNERFHSTTYDEYKKVHQRKKFTKISPKNTVFTTSTPKTTSPNESLLLKPYLTSTPRRPNHQSTNFIPLKRLLYHQKDSRRQRYSIQRALNSLDGNKLQWI
ncbi:unnamed protein product [Adineta ricciae]|uniref:Uncharacterized protein n=1 Tax=Adineta ricciae TaxID=249248 RepID=A0A814NIG4_ADIRI|nr:unnamed protein product [Adineta ricciae]